ncbi:hypothetical protein GJ496_006469 [Pomphorhynchus laevis]|nr:hypothetical protein GJ496_006469 [Pomphorhynchus laevis]
MSTVLCRLILQKSETSKIGMNRKNIERRLLLWKKKEFERKRNYGTAEGIWGYVSSKSGEIDPLIQENEVCKAELAADQTNEDMTRIAMLKALRHNIQYGDCIRALRSRIGFGLAKAASVAIRAARSPEGCMRLPPAEED